MAYNYARRRALQIAKLRAAGLDPGTNPRAAWEGLDPRAQRFATTAYARRHPDYGGGGRSENRPATRRPPTRKTPPKHQRVRGVGDVFHTSDLRLVARELRNAGRRKASLLARLFIRDTKTGAEGWRMVWVGDPNDYMEALEGPLGRVTLTVGAGGEHASAMFRRALSASPTTDGMEPAGRLAVMVRTVTTAGGFTKWARR